MTLHPLLTAIWVMDTLVLILVTGAAASACQVVLHWAPEDTSHRQLKCQYRQEAWSLATSIAAWVYLGAGFVLIGTLTNILPGLVPGAMCGTGVLQSCTPYGHRLLFLRLLGTVGLLVWQRLEMLNRSDPLATLTRNNARVLLLLLPILLLGYAQTLQALTAFDTSKAVDCCTALYDRVAAPVAAQLHRGLSPHTMLWIFGTATIVLPLLTLGTRSASERSVRRYAALLPVTASVWLVSGIVSLVRVLAPYHYEVLHHYCPWCLFLPAHQGIGFPLLFAWGLVALEASVLWALIKTRAARPAPLLASDALVRRSRCRLLIGVASFAVLAAGPAIWWRWQFGVWIGS